MSHTSYDTVAYPSHAMPQTHPDRLGAIGVLLGLTPPSIARCRVLELGCGDGNNIIPMAVAYPESSFEGVDLAATAIAKGNALITSLGLNNIQLGAIDLMEFPKDAGPFDYIIAHGLYSWVPSFVRDKVMAICRDQLSPDGIAFISYNAMPGGHVRRIFRDMMRFHVRDIEAPAAKTDQAVALLQFLAAGKAKDTNAYSMLIKEEIKGGMAEKARNVLYHDDLAEINDAFYFHEFMAQATAYGLQYLAEADFFEMTDRLYPPEVRAMLGQMGETDFLLRDQYLDFLKLRRFRQTLLVHRHQVVDRKPTPERIRKLSISSRAKPVATEPSLETGTKESFRDVSGSAISIEQALTKSALICLGESYPLPIPFAELMKAARARPGMPSDPGDEATVLEILYEAYSVGLVELHAGPPTFVRHASERPVCSPIARQQVQNREEFVTSLRHASIDVQNDLSRELIRLLDGSRDRAMLIDDLVTWAGAHPPPGEATPSPSELRQRFTDNIEQGLETIAAMGLLVA